MMNTERQQPELNLDRVFEALKRPLDLVDNPERRADFEKFIEAARVHQERAIFDLVSDIAAAVNETSNNTNVRLEYRAGHLSVVAEDGPKAGQQEETIIGDGDEVERVTIRLPARLKVMIDQAASESGTSVNSWYIRTLSRAMAGRFMRGHVAGDNGPGWLGHRGRGRRRPAGPMDMG